MPRTLFEGKSFNPISDRLPKLPAQEAQEYENEVYNILDSQYQGQIENIQKQYGQVQEELLRDVGYKLKTLEQKYWIERNHIEGSNVEPDKKRQRLLDLNKKYELAAITARNKIKPDTDNLNMQMQQQTQALQQDYQQRQTAIKTVQNLYDEGIIKDKYAVLQKQYALAGVNLPMSAFAPERPLSMEQYTKTKFSIQFQIDQLQKAAETASDDERKAIYRRIGELENYQTELLGVQLPEYKETTKRSRQLSKVGNQMLAGEKPGTLASGIRREKEKKLKTGTGKLRLFGLPGNIAANILERKAAKTTKKEIPSPAELRAKRTKEAFERGVELGYWK